MPPFLTATHSCSNHPSTSSWGIKLVCVILINPYAKDGLEPPKLHPPCLSDVCFSVRFCVLLMRKTGGGMTFQDMVRRASNRVLNYVADDLNGKTRIGRVEQVPNCNDS